MGRGRVEGGGEVQEANVDPYFLEEKIRLAE